MNVELSHFNLEMQWTRRQFIYTNSLGLAPNSSTLAFRPGLVADTWRYAEQAGVVSLERRDGRHAARRRLHEIVVKEGDRAGDLDIGHRVSRCFHRRRAADRLRGLTNPWRTTGGAVQVPTDSAHAYTTAIERGADARGASAATPFAPGTSNRAAHQRRGSAGGQLACPERGGEPEDPPPPPPPFIVAGRRRKFWNGNCGARPGLGLHRAARVHQHSSDLQRRVPLLEHFPDSTFDPAHRHTTSVIEGRAREDCIIRITTASGG